MIIYKVTNILNGKCYIGQTIQTLSIRWSEHNSNKDKKFAVHHAIAKYGKDNFCIEEIGSYTNLEDLNNAEEYFIDWHNTIAPNGYNLKPGGENHACHPETKRKLSEDRKGNKNPNYGKKASLETRQKMSAVRKGKKCRPPSEETRLKMRQAKLGKIGNRLGTKTSDETRIKISLANKGQAAWNKGIPCSEEQKLKQSILMKGRTPPNKGKPGMRGSEHPMFGKHHSEETKAKISLTKRTKNVR
jgi:group I intron endonuclease